MNTYLGTTPISYSICSTDKINNSQKITAVAADKITIGDTVYTIGQAPQNLETDPYKPLLDNDIKTIAISPNGKLLAIGGYFTNYAKLYSIDGTTITFLQNIPGISVYVNAMEFSPDGKMLVVGGRFTYKVKLYTVSNDSVTFACNLYANAGTTTLDNHAEAVAFSPDGKLLAIGGQFTGKAKLYSINGATATYISDIYSDTASTAIDNTVRTLAFSSDGKTLIVGGSFTGYAKVYSINGTAATYVSNILRDTSNALNSTVYAAKFSPNGKALALAGSFEKYAKIYSVNNTTITYSNNLYADAGTTALNSTVYGLAFSPDSKLLAVGGQFTGNAILYSIDNASATFVETIANLPLSVTGDYVNAVHFISNDKLTVGMTNTGAIYSITNNTAEFIDHIYSNTEINTLNAEVKSATFSPDGKLLVITGDFNDFIKYYAVNGATLTYLGNLTINGELYNNTVGGANFSPDGKWLIVCTSNGGYFATAYRVDGINITYAFGILNNTTTTTLYGKPNRAVFSPDGKTLVLIGAFTGAAKIYTVTDDSILYVSELYSDNNNTALSSYAYGAAFSPNGKLFVIGGQFTGYAKLYSVDGTNFTYLNDIPADATGTALNTYVRAAAFSPSGDALVLGGNFSNYGKIYAVNGSSLTFVSNITGGNTNGTRNDVVFSKSGNLLFSAEYSGLIKIHKVDGTTLTYINSVYADGKSTRLNGSVSTVAISPDESLIVAGGLFTDNGKLYQYDDTTIYYGTTIYPVAEGKFTTLPYQANVGFAIKGANAGSEATIMAIGRIAADYNLADALAAQDMLIAQINKGLEGKAIERSDS